MTNKQKNVRIIDMKHTKGPWMAKEEYDSWSVVKPDDQPGTIYIAKEIEQGKSVGKADALLIAAAPELLYACENFIKKVESGQARSTNSYALMKTAVKKAKGL